MFSRGPQLSRKGLKSHPTAIGKDSAGAASIRQVHSEARHRALLQFRDIQVLNPRVSPKVMRRLPERTTALPDSLRSRFEAASDMGLDDVRVHYNSPRVENFGALAYTHGTDIHIGAGQERHLAHEAWHVVQQKQGRVRATTRVNGFGVNDDRTLEAEADSMSRNNLERIPKVLSNTPEPLAATSRHTGDAESIRISSRSGDHVELRMDQSHRAELVNLWVTPNRRNQGVGSSLVNRAVHVARSRGVEDIHLEAHPGIGGAPMPVLKTLYRRQGFQVTGVSARGNPLMSTGEPPITTSSSGAGLLAPTRHPFLRARVLVQRMEKPSESGGPKRKASEPPTIDKELEEWLQSEGSEESYADKLKVHKIKLDRSDLACWNWALRALSDEGGPSPGEFWNYIGEPRENPKLSKDLTDSVKEKLGGLVSEVKKAGLYWKTRRTREQTIKPYSPQELNKSKDLLVRTCELLVTAHGFDIQEVNPAAYIVCQYIRAEGFAVPEHWWIELPGGVVIQTVTGAPLEVGKEETKWHSSGGRSPGDADKYGEIRIGVKALKGRHIEILKDAMNDEKKKPKPKRGKK